jgi:hypothetical protein
MFLSLLAAPSRACTTAAILLLLFFCSCGGLLLLALGAGGRGGLDLSRRGSGSSLALLATGSGSLASIAVIEVLNQEDEVQDGRDDKGQQDLGLVLDFHGGSEDPSSRASEVHKESQEGESTSATLLEVGNNLRGPRDDEEQGHGGLQVDEVGLGSEECLLADNSKSRNHASNLSATREGVAPDHQNNDESLDGNDDGLTIGAEGAATANVVDRLEQVAHELKVRRAAADTSDAGAPDEGNDLRKLYNASTCDDAEAQEFRNGDFQASDIEEVAREELVEALLGEDKIHHLASILRRGCSLTKGKQSRHQTGKQKDGIARHSHLVSVRCLDARMEVPLVVFFRCSVYRDSTRISRYRQEVALQVVAVGTSTRDAVLVKPTVSTAANPVILIRCSVVEPLFVVR